MFMRVNEMPPRREPLSVEASATFSESDCNHLSGSAVARLPSAEAYRTEIFAVHVAVDPEPV